MDDLPTRWEVELEFVQSLANIQYVNYLAQNGYFSDPSFIAYLEYLNYWQDAKYARYLVYPNCLHILTLLQKEAFRKDIVNPDFMNTLMNDMVQKWQRPEDSPEEEQNTEADGVEKKEGNSGQFEPNGKTGEAHSEIKVQNKDLAESMN